MSVEYAARAREIFDLYKIFSGRPERKRLTSKPKHRCDDNIKMYLSLRLIKCFGWNAVCGVCGLVLNLHDEQNEQIL